MGTISKVRKTRADWKSIGLLALALAASAPSGAAQEISAETIPARLLFAISGGAWQAEDAASGQTEGAPARGYFRALAFRSQDNTSRLFIQRIALEEAGPQIAETISVEAFNGAGLYLVGMQAEPLSGPAGFSLTAQTKDAPDASDIGVWSIYIDEFGELVAEPASN